MSPLTPSDKTPVSFLLCHVFSRRPSGYGELIVG